MTFNLKNVIIFIFSICFFICTYKISAYFLSLTLSGDLIRYESLWDNLRIFEISKFEDLFLAPKNLLLISATIIGSFQFIYPLIVYFLSKLIAFKTYILISSGIYGLFFSNLFLKGDYFFLRIILIFPIFFNIYTFGLISVLDRLKIALIFILISSFSIIPKAIKNLLLLLSVLTHFTALFIVLPILSNTYFNPSKIKSFPTITFKLPNLINISLKKIMYFLISLLFFALISFLIKDKFTAWFPFVVSFFENFSAAEVIKRSLEIFFIGILMYPNFSRYKMYPIKEHFFSITPILFTTLLLGGFRTLILAYIFYAIYTLRLKDRSKIGLIQLLVFSFLSVLTFMNGLSFINKLESTGFGY